MSGRLARLALLACAAALLLCPSAQAAFGFRPGTEGFEAVARADGGSPATLAGSHPYALTAKVAFQVAGGFPEGDLRDLRIDLPPGLIQNPAALPRCTATQFNTPRSSPFEESRSGESCPAATQVGTVDVHSGGGARSFGLFNLVPAPGMAAELGFAPYGTPIALRVNLRPLPDGSYATRLEVDDFPQAFPLEALDLSIWGTPWAASHDGERGQCLNEAEPDFPWAKCSAGEPKQHRPLAFLSLPTECGKPLVYAATVSAWQGGGEATRSFEGPAEGLEGCGAIAFKPFAFGRLSDRKASSSSGFRFLLQETDEGLTDPIGEVASQAKHAVVTLAEGVTINPSVGAGLGSCTPAQYAAETPFAAPGEGCPNAAEIGDFTVKTPLFEESLEGAIYLAEPDDLTTTMPGAENPFDSLLAVYLVTRSAGRGILVKVAGKIVPDPVSGRLTADFDHLPQLPYSALEVNFRTGQRAPLVTPASCGAAPTAIDLTPWAGVLQSVHTQTVSQIDAGIGGAPCPSGAMPPFEPAAIAGAINSNAGSYTPYFVHLARQDTEQEITSYSMVLPRGITAKLAGIPFCPDAAIAAARTRRGAAELTHPSCPAASRVGHTLSGYGVGAALAHAEGDVYLAGPYHGSPLSIVTINAAMVGPFDLGTIVIRSAFEVDPVTAQLRIDSKGSDPIPHILAGVPLRLRDVRVYIDRPEFTRNPTGCEPSELSSTLTGAGTRFDDTGDDSSATTTVHFQLLNCRTLDFRPKLGLSLGGSPRRGAYPALRAVFRARSGDADLKRIAVTMPHSEFLAQNHIREVCTREQFSAGRCPVGSVYGSASAVTPLFDEPMRGPVYLRSSSHRLPDLVADLHSGAVQIVLSGEIGPAKGGIRAFFDDLPDAPLTRFVLRMRGGRHGLLVNSANICAAPPSATVKGLAQNNLGAVFQAELRGQCKHKGKRGRGRR